MTADNQPEHSNNKHQDQLQIELRDKLAEFGDKTISLFVPRPDIQVGGEKWRILQKNLLDKIDDSSPQAEKIRNAVESLDLSDFSGEGIAYWESGDKFAKAELNRRPVALMATEREPFMLPVLSDITDSRTRWVVAIDRDEPKLYLYSGGALIDKSDKLDGVDYDTIEERRMVQDDVFFHSSSRGRNHNSDASSTFHALGTDTESEREKTDGAYYLETAKAVASALPMQTYNIVVVGGPKTAGLFSDILEPSGLNITQIHLAGDALDPAELTTRLNDMDLPPLEVPYDTHQEGQLETAAKSGQIDTLYISQAHDFLEDAGENADEHLRIRNLSDYDKVGYANAMAWEAMKNGASIAYVAEDALDTPEGMNASMRW